MNVECVVLYGRAGIKKHLNAIHLFAVHISHLFFFLRSESIYGSVFCNLIGYVSGPYVAVRTARDLNSHRVNVFGFTNHISNLSVPKYPNHLTPCPFLRRRGFCKKGPSRDFLHRNSQPPNLTQSSFHNPIDHAPPPYI